MYQEDYLLAKVGIYADRHSWFGCPLPEKPLSADQISVTGEEDGGGWLGRRREKKRQKRLQREYIQKLQEYEEQREELRENVRQLWTEVFSEVERAGGTGEISCVYEDSLRFLTDNGAEDALCWSSLWNVPEFRAYKSMRWTQPLLKYAGNADFVLLGAADCIPVILPKLAPHMRSLRWYVCEGDLSEDLQEWVEDFYEDYGLAIDMRILAGKNVFKTLRLNTGLPVCVLDFTEEINVPAGDLAKGSIWLDFASVEEKERRIAKRTQGVRYESLKKYWGAKTKMLPLIPACCAESRFTFP